MDTRMDFSASGLLVLEDIEQWREQTYDDATSKTVYAGEKCSGVLSIGYGHTGADVIPGMIITRAQGEALLRADVATAVAGVNHWVKVPLNQNQFDALVIFTYNVGVGRPDGAQLEASGFAGSTLLRLVNARDFGTLTADGVGSTGAVAQFARWNKSGGKVMAGLIKRRRREAELFSKAA